MSNTENKKTDLNDLEKKVKEKAGNNAAIHLIRIRNKNCFDCPDNEDIDKKDGISSWFEKLFPCCSGDRNEECPDEDPDDKD